MSYIAGLDIGSAKSKAVIMQDAQLLVYSTLSTGGNFSRSAETVLAEALEKASLAMDQIEVIGALGLGATFIQQDYLKNIGYFLPKPGHPFRFPIRADGHRGRQPGKQDHQGDPGGACGRLPGERPLCGRQQPYSADHRTGAGHRTGGHGRAGNEGHPAGEVYHRLCGVSGNRGGLAGSRRHVQGKTSLPGCTRPFPAESRPWPSGCVWKRTT